MNKPHASGLTARPETDPPLITVIATGGTIASQQNEDGSSSPHLGGQALLARLGALPPVRLKPVDLFAKDSSTLTLADMQAVSDSVGAELAAGAAGVVVLHGTDAMEETALLLSLQHPGAPVVLTGAQFTDDHPQADGPANMTAAIRAVLQGGGVRLAFGGRLLPAWGLVKHATDSADAFRLAVDAPPPALTLTAPVGKGEGMFWHIHVDTFLTAVLMGLVIVVAFWLGTRKATAGVPGKWQAFVEICLEFVDRQAKDTYHGKSKLVTPIAITIFFWILLMNLLKMIPADFIAKPLEWAGVHYWKPVPTADVNATLGMAISVFFLMLFFALKSKGLGGFIKEFLTAPFGKWMMPFNLILNIVEWLSKPISLAMRLFGNMFGGEIVFLLIWVLGGAGILGMLGGGVLGLGWMLFHLLVIPLQAFIFMMLSIVYLSLAEDDH